MPRRDDPAPDAALRCAVAKLYTHDFRNPISALSANLGYVESALPEGCDEVREAIADCASSVGALRHLVDNFVQIARIEGGEHVEASPLPLREFVEGVLRESRALVAGSGATLRLDGEVPDAECCLELPYATLILRNLLVAAAANAVCRGGSVTLRVSADGATVRFSVCDTGPIVAEPRRGDLLSLATQIEAKSNSSLRYARGLGLYAAGLAADFLGGGATVGVRDGEFEVAATLPREPAP